MRWLLLLLVACSIPSEEGSVNVFFCDKVDCEQLFIDTIVNPSCALYRTSAKIEPFLTGGVVVDGDASFDAFKESGSGLMHNKFCVWGNHSWTGSWNPSQSMSIPNNVVLIESKTIAKAFEQEFNELHSGIFHGGKKGSAKVLLNGSLVEAYFCPEDNCQEQVLRVLSSAKSSIHFMTFSFTDDKIGDLLLEKSKSVSVKGIFDPRMDKHSEFEKLKSFSIKKSVHHKVFIVDGSTVITGSYNPSRNGNERNDENIVIIHDKDVGVLFEAEFASLQPGH